MLYYVKNNKIADVGTLIISGYTAEGEFTFNDAYDDYHGYLGWDGQDWVVTASDSYENVYENGIEFTGLTEF